MKTLTNMLIMVAVAINVSLLSYANQIIPDHIDIIDSRIIERLPDENKDALKVKSIEANVYQVCNENIYNRTIEVENWMVDPDSWILVEDEDNEQEIILEEWMSNAFNVHPIN